MATLSTLKISSMALSSGHDCVQMMDTLPVINWGILCDDDGDEDFVSSLPSDAMYPVFEDLGVQRARAQYDICSGQPGLDSVESVRQFQQISQDINETYDTMAALPSETLADIADGRFNTVKMSILMTLLICLRKSAPVRYMTKFLPKIRQSMKKFIRCSRA